MGTQKNYNNIKVLLTFQKIIDGIENSCNFTLKILANLNL